VVAVVVILNVVVLARFVEWHVAVWGLALNAVVAVVAVTDVVVVAVTVVVAATVAVVVAAVVVVQSCSDVWKRAHRPGVLDCPQLQRVAGFDVVVVAVTVVVVAATVVVVVAAVVVQSYSDVWKRAHKPGVVDCLQLQRVAGFELLEFGACVHCTACCCSRWSALGGTAARSAVHLAL